jgi:tungstate transport system ATP-binding protein
VSEVLYHLDAVTRRYGERTVLHIDRLEVFAGETLCLIGPTGAGKSTLLRLLAGLEPPTAGELRFGEYRLGRDLPLEVQRRIALVFQRPLLLTGTVQTNVEYGLKLRGRRRDTVVTALLDRLGLSAFASRFARTLSGGETQLVALARALVLEPEILLLDEPTANLDPARVVRAEEVVRELRGERGTTLVWATHNLFQARRVADRTALLLDGRLVEVGPTHEFFERPRDPRTAAFVRGEMVY